jgi:hypothetical protein
MSTMRKNNSLFKRMFFLIAVFGLGTAVALSLYDKIQLPFHNPWNIRGLLAKASYNPSNNIIRFIAIVLAPSLLLALASLFKDVKNSILSSTVERSFSSPSDSSIMRNKWLFFVSLLLCFFIAVNMRFPQYNPCTFSSFHEGESLGTGMSYLKGKVPYRDMLFVHGLFQDPLRSVIAFKIFGTSIGSMKTLNSAMRVLSFLLLFVSLLVLFRGEYLYAYAVFCILIFLIFNHYLVIQERDLTTFSFLAVTACLVNDITGHKGFTLKHRLCVFFFSWIPIVSFCYSIDRGFYLLATYCVLLPIVLSLRTEEPKHHALLFAILGLLFGIAVVAALHGRGFTSFIDFTFFTMPRYKELMDGGIYPFGDTIFLTIVLLISANVFWMTYRFLLTLHLSDTLLAGVKNFVRTHTMEICLLAMSVFFFRSALGRADWYHVSYSTAPTYILTCYIIIKHYLHNMLENHRMLRKIFVDCTIIGIGYVSVLCVGMIIRTDLLSATFPVRKPDSAFIPENYKQTISFLRANLAANENFFTMTSEASWYYFIGKASPTRFPVVWFAMPPFYQEEIVASLKANNVKFILYRNLYWSNYIDDITSQERLPIVDAYIRAHYRYYKTIDDNELWIKRP